MASKIPNGGGKVELNDQGMIELFLSDEVAGILKDRMQAVKAAVPGSDLYVTQGPRGGKYARAVVRKGSDYDEANTGELSRALDLAGGRRGTRTRFQKPTKGA